MSLFVSGNVFAVNIPYKLWDETTAKTSVNEGFKTAVEALATQDGMQIAIFFCRSGGRSQDCLSQFDSSLFEVVYEIDYDEPQNGFGGFEGTTYSNRYLGYRGFPGRNTHHQDPPSISWKDTALPIKTGVNPLPAE